MKKVFAIFDLHPGNYNFIRSTLNNIKGITSEEDNIYIITTKQTQEIYKNEIFLNFINQVKLNDSLKFYYVDQKINFGQNLKNFTSLNTESQVFIFKTTFPIFYYNEPFKDINDYKQVKDNWFMLQGNDVVNVPDRSGKIVKVNDNMFMSRKSEQNVVKVRNNVVTYEPDYFIFGKQFFDILLMVNEFKQNNFMVVIDRATKLKKPITFQNSPVCIRKYWSNIQGSPTYTLIPQYMMPVVAQVNEQKLTVIKFPTVVGNKYFKNSQWLGGMIGNIVNGNVTYKPNRQQSITGVDIIKNISMRYDIDANSAIYISKIIKMFQQISPEVKINFYTKNPIIKYVYQKSIEQNILKRINWIEGPYNSLANYFDYSNCVDPFKFDFNFYSLNSGDYDKSLREMMGLETQSVKSQKTGKPVLSLESDTLVRVLPMSVTLLTKDGYLSQLMQISKDYKNIKIYLEPVNIQANNPVEFEQKTKSAFNTCQEKIKKDMNENVQVELLFYRVQKQYIDKLFEICQSNNNFYFINRNMAFSIANNYGKQIYLGGNV